MREKIANVININIEDFLGKEIKVSIMETFQEFLSNANEVEEEVDEDGKKEKPMKKKTKTTEPTIDVKPAKPTEPAKPKLAKTKSKSSVKAASEIKATQPSVKSSQIEKLKSYVFKCGVRKIW